MFIVNWFRKLFSSLPMFQKEAKVLFLGLENAGKTSMMLRLTENRFAQLDPTNFAVCKEVKVGQVKFRAFDLGGQESMRKIWKNYFEGLNGIIYMVDTADHEALRTSRDELANLIHDPKLANVPILVFGNKIDKSKALSEPELLHELSITDNDNKIFRKNIALFMCSVAKNAGIFEGFEWFSQQILSQAEKK